jgi:histone H2B
MPKSVAQRSKSKKGRGGGARKQSYASYLYRILKQIYPDTGITKRGMDVLESLNTDVFERLANEAGRLMRARGGRTLGTRDVASAVRLVFPGELSKYAVVNGTRAVTKFKSTTPLPIKKM